MRLIEKKIKEKSKVEINNNKSTNKNRNNKNKNLNHLNPHHPLHRHLLPHLRTLLHKVKMSND
jgi:hypothetical protein